MITFDEARRIMMETVVPTGSESVPLAASLGRILACDVCSDVDMPPFNKSAMDGYACRQADLKNELTVIENIPAGRVPQLTVEENQCSKIMTGAVVPEGADCVIMVEHTEETETGTVRFLRDSTKSNICYKAEDITVGDLVLPKGERISPAHVASLATMGCAMVEVAIRPKVGIIATGSELVEPGQELTGAKIRNSNGWQLAAQAEAMGCDVTNYGIAIDSEKILDAAIKVAIADNDVVILSGGVSMGDYDFVPGLLKENGIELLFDRVAIKPGKPSTFGVGETVRCMGLPGNPVSTFVQFEIMLKPFLYKMMGHDFKPTMCKAALDETIRQRQMKRIAIIPVAFTAPDRVAPVDYHGSAHITAMCHADGIITIPHGDQEIVEGSLVDVRLLQ
jgi:molybdopterin molybdotransferase